ncbi:hypothetical protein LEP1GSC127_3195 [Leptospira kirschneri str. 200801925]|nr:hypothetical protein LEP1GSC127_3195 [Leptospira kirschneri str. 200801925]
MTEIQRDSSESFERINLISFLERMESMKLISIYGLKYDTFSKVENFLAFQVKLRHKIKPLYYKKIIIHTEPNEV